ncbi:hypothetical protein N9J72_00180 [Candidatus Gracilibacteria bacterium]|nr:hypothetical protein [Candidatus Gracilibacteria bacterium]
MNRILQIIETGRTVFSKNDLRLYWDFPSSEALDKYIQRALKKGELQKISYGIYGLKNYKIFELATKLRKKSYISLETVLKRHGIIFQHYDSIFSISDNTCEKEIDGQNFSYKKIKDSILLNPQGIIQEDNIIIASLERAICDRVYLSKDYYFDDLSSIDLEKLHDISHIYNKRVVLEIAQIIQHENKQRNT